MTEWALHPAARPRAVLREQLRAVGLVLRSPAAAMGALLVLAMLFAITRTVHERTPMDFHPERWIIPGLVGVLLPIVVWRGEGHFGAGFLWTLPVDRRRHALAKVAAGWVWLMAGVGIFVLWLLALSLISGGNVLGTETLKMIPAFPQPGPRLDPGIIRTAAWTPDPVLWLVPFTAATGTYLLASALGLGVRHPFRWVAGVVLGFALLATASDAANADGLAQLPEHLMGMLVGGRYGLEAVLIASTETLKVETALTTGEVVVVWRGVPDPGQWARATLLWTALGLAALWAAASRHREDRRA
jgi:hypothetical protein